MQWLIRTDEPFRGHCQSVVNPDGTIAYTDGLTVDTYEAANGFPVRVIGDDEFNKLIDEFVAGMISDPVEITKERFWEMLEILPPCRWSKHRAMEMFHVSERLTHNLVSWFARLGDRYFECVDRDNIDIYALATKFVLSRNAAAGNGRPE